MVYSKLYKRENKKVLLSLTLIGISVVVLWLFLFIQDLGYKNGWEKTQGIERLQVVNKNPHGFDIIWLTKQPVKEQQWVEWKSNDSSQGRGVVEQVGTIYRSSITGLKPQNTYTFKVRVGNKTYILNNLISSSVLLPKESKELPISPAYGKALLPSGKPYSNGLLIYEVEGFSPLAAITKETGEWLLPLTGLINNKTGAIASVSDNLPVTIRLFSYPNGSIHATVGRTRPLQQAITAGTTRQLAKTNNGTVLGIDASKNTIPEGQLEPSILYPKERALIPGNKPLMRGTALPGRDVLAYIQGPLRQYSYRTIADSKGEWLIQYPLPLEPGNYKFSITTLDKSGHSLTLRRSFLIVKSGEQVLGVATNSPTLIPTPTIIAVIPTIAPTGIPTIQPTLIATNPTSMPTIVTPTLKVAGGGINGALMAALFCIVIGAGLILAF